MLFRSFVTHDMDIIKRLCERCIYLEHGRIIKEGPAAELADLYLRRARENMNKENLSLQKTLETDQNAVVLGRRKKERSGDAVCADGEFEKRVRRFREGDGKAKVIRAELLDDAGDARATFQYNEKVRLQIYVQFGCALKNVGVGYHIRDGKNTEIIGSGQIGRAHV